MLWGVRVPYSREERACRWKRAEEKEGKTLAMEVPPTGSERADCCWFSRNRSVDMLLSRTSSMCANYSSRFSSKTKSKEKKTPQDSYSYQPPTGIDIITDQVSNHLKLACRVLQKGPPVLKISPLCLPVHRKTVRKCPSSTSKTATWHPDSLQSFKILIHEIFMLNPQLFNQDKQNNNMKKQAAEETGLICTLMNIILFLQTHLFGVLRSPCKRGFSVVSSLNWSLAKTN